MLTYAQYAALFHFHCSLTTNHRKFAEASKPMNIGSQILTGSASQYIRTGEEIAYTHHERWDGSGYPRRLQGEDIPPAGIIMNIADQYDALRSERPYKPAFDHVKTCSIIIKGDGRTLLNHFEPDIYGPLKIYRKNSG